MPGTVDDDLRNLRIPEVCGEKALFIHQDRRPRFRIHHATVIHSRRGNVKRVPPEIAELGPFAPNNEQAGAWTDRVPAPTGAPEGFAEPQIGKRRMQPLAHDPFALQLYLIDAVRDLRIAGIAKVVDHEYAQPWNREERFSRPLLDQVRWHHRHRGVRTPATMHVDGPQRHQCLSRAALGDNGCGMHSLPALRNAHQGDRLGRKRPAQQLLHPWRYRVLKALQRGVLMQNSFSKFFGECLHVVVNCLEFLHKKDSWGANLLDGFAVAGTVAAGRRIRDAVRLLAERSGHYLASV